MQRLISLIFIIGLAFGCSHHNKNNPQPLTNQQKASIEKLSWSLIASINDFDFSVITSAWNNQAFKERVSNITKTQQNVFEHVFEKDLKRKIKVGNLSIIHEVNSGSGRVSQIALNHFDYHSELILLLTFEGRYNFFKYRIEVVNNKPAITDFFQFADNLWYSEKITNMLRLNSKFNAYSKERAQANRALAQYRESLQYGDTLDALNALYNIPETHQMGNGLSLMKLNLAWYLGDSTYMDVLAIECKNNKSLYMKYLYAINFDSTNLDAVYQVLSDDIGESATLDSLIRENNYWNY